MRSTSALLHRQGRPCRWRRFPPALWSRSTQWLWSASPFRRMTSEDAQEGTQREDERWFTRSVASIGGASFFADLGYEMPTSLLPSFLTTTLGAPAAALGLIEGFADRLGGVSRLAGGAIADDPARRRKAAVGGYTATAFLGGAIGLATAVWQVGALRVAAWVARGLRAPSRSALLTEAVSEGSYGRAFGYERAMDL